MRWPRTCISGGGLRKHIRRRLDIRGKGTALRLRLFQLRGEGGQGLVDLGGGWCGRFLGFLAAAGHQGLVARHAKDALRGASIAQVLNLALAVAASEAVGAESLVTGQYGQVLDLVATVVAAVGAVVADERAVAEEQQVGVRVEQRAARVAAEAVDVPSVAGCAVSVRGLRSRKARGRHTELEGLALLENLGTGSASGAGRRGERALPLHSPCTGTRRRPGRRPGRAATLGSRRASPWWAGAGRVGAVVATRGGGASGQAGRVVVVWRWTGDGQQAEVKGSNIRGAASTSAHGASSNAHAAATATGAARAGGRLCRHWTLAGRACVRSLRLARSSMCASSTVSTRPPARTGYFRPWHAWHRALLIADAQTARLRCTCAALGAPPAACC